MKPPPPTRRSARRLRVGALLLLAALILYVGPAIALWSLQESLLFPAPAVPRAQLDARAAQLRAEPITLTTSDGLALYAWVSAQRTDRLVLYFHGNGSTPAEAWRLRDELAPHGIGLLAITYRGYPPSQGRPSEVGMIDDARAAWRYATHDLGVAPEHIIVHGRSLGGGVATALAAEVEPAALVLEATFASVADVAQQRYPIYPARWLIRHPFDSLARAPNVRAPVLLIHGDQDRVVPVAHGRRLARAFPRSHYIEVAGQGHNDPLALSPGEPLRAYRALLESPSWIEGL